MLDVTKVNLGDISVKLSGGKQIITGFKDDVPFSMTRKNIDEAWISEELIEEEIIEVFTKIYVDYDIVIRQLNK